MARNPRQHKYILVYPDHYVLDGQSIFTSIPITKALEAANPGTILLLNAGTYGPFGFKPSFGGEQYYVRTLQSTKDQPVVLRGLGNVRIESGQFGGCVSVLGFEAYVNFENITFFGPKDAAACILIDQLYNDSGIWKFVKSAFNFYNCHIDGGYDHITRTGTNSKWGVLTWGLSTFRWLGGSVKNIKYEHAFYIHTSFDPQGVIAIKNVLGRHLGRTFIQQTDRAIDSPNIFFSDLTDPSIWLPEGQNKWIVENNDVEDTGLNFWGGYALTFTGRHNGEVNILGNRCITGFNPELTQSIMENPDYAGYIAQGKPLYTGNLTILGLGQDHDKIPGFVQLPHKKANIVDNEFLIAPGFGDRENTQVACIDDLNFVGITLVKELIFL